MESRLLIIDKRDGKLIRFKVNREERPKVLFFLYGIVFIVLSFYGIQVLLSTRDWSFISLFGACVFTPLIIGCFVVAYRYFNKATETEEIFINKDVIEIIEKALFKSVRRSFDLSYISNFHFVENEKYIAHPLAGESIDYLGFAAKQKEVEKIYEDGNFVFDYDGSLIRFGKSQGSWVFNELDVFIYEYTGRDLRYLPKPEL